MMRRCTTRLRKIASSYAADPEYAGNRNYRLAYAYKTWVTDDLAPDLGASFAADLLGYALGEVDWQEIATAWLSEVEA